ncbi:hypothetical protein Tco_1303484 [Tanacetum coccineum]
MSSLRTTTQTQLTALIRALKLTASMTGHVRTLAHNTEEGSLWGEQGHCNASVQIEAGVMAREGRSVTVLVTKVEKLRRRLPMIGFTGLSS